MDRVLDTDKMLRYLLDLGYPFDLADGACGWVSDKCIHYRKDCAPTKYNPTFYYNVVYPYLKAKIKKKG